MNGYVVPFVLKAGLEVPFPLPEHSAVYCMSNTVKSESTIKSLIVNDSSN